jgi:hypothetical protein
MSETERPRRLQSVWAVLAGLLAVIFVTTVTDAALHATGVFPPFGQPMADALFMLATAYRVVYGVAGGYVAARLAPHGPVRHAVAVGVIGSLLGAAGAVATWERGPAFGPKWYSLAVIAIAVPSAWVGGILRAWQLRRARG